MKIITPNSNIVRSPNPIKRTKDQSVRVVVPELVVKKHNSLYHPIIKTNPPHL